jgi:TonB family protein
MLALPPTLEIPQSAHVPRLLVELPSWRQTFLQNLRDVVSPAKQTPLELRSAPAPFWPDVFVKGETPWEGLIRSGGVHLIACGLLLGMTRILALQPQVAVTPAFDHSQVIYYDASQYLPALDSRRIEAAAAPRKADPELSKQPIISVPAEADNRGQTVVTPPKVKLRRDTAMPNIVAWTDRVKRPQLEIPPAPLTLAAEITRIAPRLNDSAVAPPPDAGRLNRQRNSRTMQNSVVAPPPEVRAANTPSGFSPLQPAIVAPPPSLENTPSRLSDINIARSAVIAPAPQLPVEAQRSLPGGGPGAPGALTAQVVPPPPSVGASGAAGASYGSPGRVIALNLHPTVGAPPDPPAGNRRGTFAATPEGRAGASGTPGSTAGAAGRGDGAGSGKRSSDLPAGLYVGETAAKTSPVAGNPGKSASSSVNPNLLANVPRRRVTTAPPMQADSAAKLSDAERTVFGNRKFYSVSLNMPNLNSAGGSWVIRFAELRRDSVDPIHRDDNAAAVDLSQPMATRKVDPAYPMQLMRENVAGTVILYAIIRADGSVDGVRVLQGADERLNRFASAAVAQWKFDPATKNGAPVDVEATFRIPFKPAKMGSNF